MMKMTPLFTFLILSATQELVRGGCTSCDSPPSPCKSCVQPVHVREGEMAVLQCPLRTTMAGHREGNLTLAWSNHSGPGELQEPAVWRSEDTLVILRVSPNQQGSYSCSLLDASGQPLRTAWFNITVFSGQCYTDMDVYVSTCYLRQSCEKLTCTSDSIPQNFTKHNYTWYKNCDTELPSDFGDGYLMSASENDSGYYTCTSYYTYNSNLHDGQVFTLSRTMERTVREGRPQVMPKIIRPQDGEVINVDMGSTVVVVCMAVLSSESDLLYWLENRSFVEDNQETLPVFSNTSEENGHHQASLVIRQVSEEQLRNRYTCQVESPSRNSNVSIIFQQKSPPQFHFLVLGIVGVFAVTVVVVTVVYVKLKVDIILFLRDDLGWHHHNVSDGKRYDAYVLCYKSDTESGVSEEDRRQVEEVLEEEYGYSLCLYDRDVLPGEAVAEAVLGCIEQSRRLILVPSSLGLNPGQDSQYSLLTGLHAALVERQTWLVLIQTESAPDSQVDLELDSLPEALRLLAQSGHTVTWRGSHSKPLSSPFWKELRYRMPARTRRRPPKDERTIL
ncbi:interleukin-18 receptor 1-like isoform X1 [Salmo trutta]|uniref:Interleukin-18 receptor 1-like n=2 Tax=Salmo trutta TaxID=8032 RepID=A0A674AI89_SALTR|nr:interleukin-18 receptor 1-like isoform X1 [Salmo trutta]XP_029603304.1 interleukin-18 receptor 1-like isoform X1 [Salmo trutta]